MYFLLSSYFYCLCVIVVSVNWKLMTLNQIPCMHKHLQSNTLADECTYYEQSNMVLLEPYCRVCVQDFTLWETPVPTPHPRFPSQPISQPHPSGMWCFARWNARPPQTSLLAWGRYEDLAQPLLYCSSNMVYLQAIIKKCVSYLSDVICEGLRMFVLQTKWVYNSTES